MWHRRQKAAARRAVDPTMKPLPSPKAKAKAAAEPAVEPRSATPEAAQETADKGSDGLRRWVKPGSVWESIEKKEGREAPSVSSSSSGASLPKPEAGVSLRLGRNWQVAEADRKVLLQIFNKLTQLMKVAPHDFRVILKDSAGAMPSTESKGASDAAGAMTPQADDEKVHIVLHSAHPHSWIYPVSGARDAETHNQVMILYNLLERVLGRHAGDDTTLQVQAVLCGHRMNALPALQHLEEQAQSVIICEKIGEAGGIVWNVHEAINPSTGSLRQRFGIESVATRHLR